MNFKLDIKSIAILVLLGACIIFFGMWFFKGDDTKDRVKQLEKDVKKIEVVRDSLKAYNVKLKGDYDSREKDITDRDNQIKIIESQLSIAKGDLRVANGKVAQNAKDLADTRKKIEELKKNPVNRTDDALINSLKEKLK